MSALGLGCPAGHEALDLPPVSVQLLCELQGIFPLGLPLPLEGRTEASLWGPQPHPRVRRRRGHGHEHWFPAMSYSLLGNASDALQTLLQVTILKATQTKTPTHSQPLQSTLRETGDGTGCLCCGLARRPEPQRVAGRLPD